MKIKTTTPKVAIAEVNIVPLLDVVLAILAVFILLVAGLALPRKIGVDLPSRKDNSESQPLNSDLLVLTLDQAGNLGIEGEVLNSSQLEQRIKQFLQAKPQGLVVLNAANPTVSYQLVISKLATLRDVAGDRVAIATSEQQDQPNQPNK